MLELNWIAAQGAGEAEPALASSTGRVGKTAVVGMLLAAFLGALAAGVAVWRSQPSMPPRPVTRFALTLPPDQRWPGPIRHLLALSPDGAQLVYVANPQLYIRAMDDLEPRPLQGTEETTPRTPFFSPDGQWVGFWSEGSLKKVPLRGGPAVTICQASSPLGASWGMDDTVLLGGGRDGIFQVRASGGTPGRVIEIEEGEIAHGPQMLPDGHTVLYTLSRGNWDDAQIVAQSLQTGERQAVLEQARDARYVPTGHLLFGRQGNVFGIRFDSERRLATGDPIPVLEDVMQTPSTSLTGTVQFAVSASGSLVYRPAGSGVPEGTLVRVDRGGASRQLSAKAGSYLVPRLSPDGQRLAVVQYSQDNPRDIWNLDLKRDAWTRLTFHSGWDTQPLWTPDGRFIYFSSDRLGGRDVFKVPADGTGESEQVLGHSESLAMPTSWSPDGGRLAFHIWRPGTLYDIGILEVGDEAPVFVLETTFNEAQPAFSPDGNLIAYTSDETGQPEIYVRPYPGPGRKIAVSTNGGWSPHWSPTGEELFYREDDKMISVPVRTRPGFSAGQPVVLFEGQFRNAYGILGNVPECGVTPDGEGFVMIQYGMESYQSQQIRVVLNWFENNLEK